MSCLFPLSHFADSNRRPTHYECVALPTELKWRLNCGCKNTTFWETDAYFLKKTVSVIASQEIQ